MSGGRRRRRQGIRVGDWLDIVQLWLFWVRSKQVKHQFWVRVCGNKVSTPDSISVQVSEMDPVQVFKFWCRVRILFRSRGSVRSSTVNGQIQDSSVNSDQTG
ncbi:hypothetical protein Hanom_Chr04g00356911 [Helianthus anomalus]